MAPSIAVYALKHLKLSPLYFYSAIVVFSIMLDKIATWHSELKLSIFPFPPRKLSKHIQENKTMMLEMGI